MPDLSGIDWDDAFANAAHIPDGMHFPDRWDALADAFRRRHSDARTELGYGDHPREKLDLFLPDSAPKGLVVFVHGGYWLDFDKSCWSHLAAGPLRHRWAVALPSYRLAPETTIPQITAQVAQAVTFAAGRVPGPIRLAGHSAGGHLVSRMACSRSPLAPDIAARLAHVVSISGLHDLRPLLLTAMNDKLRLTADDAATESAALQPPLPGISLTAWVGGNERPEFLRQSSLLVENWRRAGADTTLIVEPGRNHFDVIGGLADHDSALTRDLTGSDPA